MINLPFITRPKKNNQNIIWNQRTGKPMIIQSKQYLEYEKMCKPLMAQYSNLKIDTPINLKCIFYVPDKRTRDLTNLLNAVQDVLVKYGVLEDDNYKIVESLDGSRILYEKGREETIIEITPIKKITVKGIDNLNVDYFNFEVIEENIEYKKI